MQYKTDAVYIHIPFCNYICAYCDFCKVFYNRKYVTKYLNALEQEIKTTYKGEIITSLYIGGGTPSSLSLDELKKLFEILKIFNLSEDCEFTFESNPDSLTIGKIKLLKECGINRVSLGVETVNDKLQNIIERKTNKDIVITCIKNLKNIGITNINVDLIYAIKGESLKDLRDDLNFILSLDVPHISTYSLIIEDNTKLKINNINNIDRTLDRKMYDLLSIILKDNGYIHYEISNFAKVGYQSKHNLKYWENKHYYGFGVGASGYLNNVRYTNTRSITKYIEGKVTNEKEVLTTKDEILYEIMLGLRTNKGIDKKVFRDKYNINIEDLINYQELVKIKVLDEDKNYLKINEDYFYVLDDVLMRLIEEL